MEHHPTVEPMHRQEKWLGFQAFEALMAEALDDVEAPPAVEPADEPADL